MNRFERQRIDYTYYQDLWENPPPSSELFSPERWDERADEWARRLETNKAYRAREMARVQDTANFSRKNGLLGPGSTALDIGCGPGLFTAEFARTAGHVTGLDLSPRMTQHAAAHAQKQGATNTDFIACDFKKADIAARGWSKAFDLVMSCLTPAIIGVQDLHKMMEISCGHCLHVSFVEASDSLEDRIAAELYGDAREDTAHWDGRVFYSVFNLLFLEGYHPKTFYFRQAADDAVQPDEQLARRYAGFLKKDGAGQESEAGRILEYLQRIYTKEGRLHRHTEECYGYLL